MNLTPVIEITESCNLSCTFCLRPTFEIPIMSIETLEKVISYILEASEDRVDFVWHGGEPLIAGIDFFKKIKEFQSKYNPNNLKILNDIQTNGTLLTKEFITFFEKEGFTIGTSIQGTRNIHDHSRVDKNGNPSFDRVIKNISGLNKKPYAVMVLTKEVLGKEKEIYYEMKKQVRGFRISEYFPRKRSAANQKVMDPLMPTSQEYTQSIKEFYRIWKEDPEPIEIKPITEFIKALVKGKCGGCLYSQQTCNFSVIGVKTNGDFYTCLRGIDKNNFIGNVNDKPLRDHETSAQKRMKERTDSLKEGQCKNCEFWNQCNGGCPQESFLLYGDIKHRSFYCSGRKALLEEIQKDLRETYEF
ncbi:radical SAM protein [Candidatus Woesearchaeota archaeon]|nr:radical SAM protein [Candidatus Woesearchaeota archaeon]